MPKESALFGGMQFALFGLLTAIVALKRQYLTLDLWVQRSPHERSLSPAMWAGDRLNVSVFKRGGFSPRFNQFCHAAPPTTDDDSGSGNPRAVLFCVSAEALTKH